MEDARPSPEWGPSVVAPADTAGDVLDRWMLADLDRVFDDGAGDAEPDTADLGSGA